MEKCESPAVRVGIISYIFQSSARHSTSDNEHRVAMGDCYPTAPTDPYVRALPHTAPRFFVSLRAITNSTYPLGVYCSSLLFVTVTFTGFPDFQASGLFPSNNPKSRRHAFLPRLLLGSVRRLLRYYKDALTSRRSSRLTSFSFARRYHASARFPCRRLLVHKRRPEFIPTPSRFLTWKRRDLASSRESSIVRSLLFSDPGRANLFRPLQKDQFCSRLIILRKPQR